MRSFHVPDVNSKNLRHVLFSQIHQGSHLMTDSSPIYPKKTSADIRGTFCSLR